MAEPTKNLGFFNFRGCSKIVAASMAEVGLKSWQ
jgi:hypothetical protein